MPTGPERILIVRPSALGDVCRTAPVLASLKRGFPNARIDWLVQDTFLDAIRGHPDLGSAVEFPRKKFGSWWRPGVAIELLRWLRAIPGGEYDLVVDCQGLARSGFFSWWTGSRRRVGYADAAELGWMWLTERVRVPREMHAVDRMLAVVEAIGIKPVRDVRLYVPRDVEPVEELRGTRYAVLAPTSRWAGKRWPPERFSLAAEYLLSAECGMDCVAVVGSEPEREQCGPLLDLAARDARVIDLMGKTSVGALMATVRDCAVVLGNDSACLHMAVGLDRPLVGLYGPTRVDRVGPYGRAHQVVQRTQPGDVLDHKDTRTGIRLMERIGVDDVLAKIQEVCGAVAAGSVDVEPMAEPAKRS